MRTVAIAAVVAFHAFPGRGSRSGYLISQIIWGRIADGTFTLAWFYGRRALRLFPALALVLAATLVTGRWLLLPDAYETLGKDVASAAAFVSNLVLWHDAGYFTENAALRPLTHLWSLAVEEQFYLVFPLLLLLTRRSWRLTGGVLALLLAGSFAWSVHTAGTDAAQALLSPAFAFLGAAARRRSRLRPAERACTASSPPRRRRFAGGPGSSPDRLPRADVEQRLPGVVGAAPHRRRGPPHRRRPICALQPAVPIVVVGPSPSWQQGLPQALYNEFKRRKLDRFPMRMQHQLPSERARVDRELRQLTRGLGVTYVAPLDVLCNHDGCLARVADAVDQLAFWDPSHFTTAGSIYFVDAVADRLLRGV